MRTKVKNTKKISQCQGRGLGDCRRRDSKRSRSSDNGIESAKAVVEELEEFL